MMLIKFINHLFSFNLEQLRAGNGDRNHRATGADHSKFAIIQ